MSTRVITIATQGPQGPQGIPGPSGSSATGSLISTASISSNIVTFTKGDSTTFDITINSVPTSSYVDARDIAQPFRDIEGISGSFDYIKVNGNITASAIFVNSNTIYIGGESISRTDIVNLKTSRDDVEILKSRSIISSSDQIRDSLDTLGLIDCCDMVRDLIRWSGSVDFTLNSHDEDITTIQTTLGSHTTTLASHSNDIIDLETLVANINDNLDNLGNHTATQDLDMNSYSISNVLNITSSGNISTNGKLIVSGSTKNTLIDSGNITTEGTLKVTSSLGYTTIRNGDILTKGDLTVTGSIEVSSGLSTLDQLSDNENDFKSGNTYFPKNREVDAMFFLGGNANRAATTLNSGFSYYAEYPYPILFWDRKINNYFIKANLYEGSFSSNFCVYMPPIINAGYAAGERVQIFNMTSGSVEGGRYDYALVHSGSIKINSFANQVNTIVVNPDNGLRQVTNVTNLNQGIYSGSWNNYRNVIYNGSNPDGLDYSIEIPPGYKGIFEVFHYGTPSSYIDITHPHPNNIAFQYGYWDEGYNTNYVSGLATEQSKVWRFIGIEPL